jgi:L(+)-tartrate dehydratase beta subunit
VPLLLERYGIRAIIGKGGMQEEVYQTAFRRHGAIYLTTVGYGLGAIYGQGIRRIKDVLWKDELGLAQAVWVLEVENFGPFWSNATSGRGLFGMANAEVNETFEKLYEAAAAGPEASRRGHSPHRGGLIASLTAAGHRDSPLLAQHAQIGGDLRPVMRLVLDACQDEC